MRVKINYLFTCILFALFAFTSCQDEVTEIENPNEQETIVPNSSLASLMSIIATNDGSIDDILDNASCFSVELPVTIVVSDITIIIETEADLAELEDLLDDVSVDDALDFIFPITIIYSDYSEIIIENADQLQTFIDECIETDNDVIECADFVYPISFSVFNSGFNLVETVLIESDEALYDFLNELEEEDNALIVSLNFPVTLEYNNGDIIEVITNEELANAIQAAEQFCEDDTDNCVEDDVLLGLLECPWDFTDGTDSYDNYQLIFNSNGSLEISEGMAASAIGGYWDLSSSDDGIVVLSISELTAFQDSLEGEWLVVSCNIDDYSVNELTLSQGNLELNLEQDCIDNLDCSVLTINSNITECAWNLETNLITDYPVDIFVHFGAEGEILIEGSDNLESQIGTWEIIVIASDIFFEFTFQDYFEVLNGQWQVSECEDGELFLQNDNNYIDLEEACEVNNQALLDCYSIYVLSQECDIDNDGLATFVIETNSPQTAECIGLYPIAGSYHPTYQDAVNTTNHLNITLTTPLELESQTVYFRVFNQDTHEYAVQELELIVESCNDAVFNCFSDFEIIECNQPNNVPVYNLNVGTIGLIDCTEVYYPSFHETLMDAQNDTNAIANTEAYGTLVAEVYLRIESESGNFEVFTIYLSAVECNYFECFGNYSLAVCDQSDNVTDGLGVFDLSLIFSNCTDDNIYYTFHETLADAETGTNAFVNPYINTINPQTIYSKVALVDNPNVYEIFTHELIVNDCSSGSCTEADIDGILTQCLWNITSYNGSDNLIGYNFSFEQNSGIVVIYNDTTTIDATWSTSQPNDGVIIEFSNVAGPNIQAINGSWLVVECTAEQLVLHNVNDSNNEIVLDRTCE